MPSLRSIVYVSSAVKPMSELELEGLLIEARDLNLETDTTGALLYSDGSFIQYFEGSDEACELTYKRIRDSRRHTGIIELVDEPIAARSFPGWEMGFAKASQAEALALSTAQWRRHAQGSDASQGMDLLRDFWMRAGK